MQCLFVLALVCQTKPSDLIKDLIERDVLKHGSPTLDTCLKAAMGMHQNDYHVYDVFDHIMCALDNSLPTPEDRMAALLHDIGKPSTCSPHPKKSGQFSFIGHEFVGAEIASTIMDELGITDPDFRECVTTAIKCHMSMKDPRPLKDHSIKKWMDKTGNHLETCIRLLKADAIAHKNDSEDDPGFTELLRKRIEDINKSPSSHS